MIMRATKDSDMPLRNYGILGAVQICIFCLYVYDFQHLALVFVLISLFVTIYFRIQFGPLPINIFDPAAPFKEVKSKNFTVQYMGFLIAPGFYYSTTFLDRSYGGLFFLAALCIVMIFIYVAIEIIWSIRTFINPGSE